MESRSLSSLATAVSGDQAPASQAVPWWSEEAGFFGSLYLEGDLSLEGHLADCHLTQQQRTEREVDGVVRLTGLRLGERVLDVPCGAGRHSIELAFRGYDVVGQDLNRVLLGVARENALHQGVRVSFEEGDMRTLGFARQFDVLINMFYSFGFFDSDEENARVLANFRAALRPGGRMLMHTDVNPPRLRSGLYRLKESRHLANGSLLQIAEDYDEATRRINGSWSIVRDGQTTSRNYSVRVYEADEFIQMCLDNGFKECKAYSDWNGASYSEQAEEIIFVCR